MKPNPNRPEIITYRLVNKPRRRHYWLYPAIGLPLIVLFAIITLAGILVLRRRITYLAGTTQTDQVIAATSDQLAVSPLPNSIPATLPPITAVAALPDCTEPQGQVLDKAFYSPTARDTIPYRIYIPPCYTQTNRRYPYVILLHGAGSDQTEWTDSLGVNQVLDQGIAAGRLPPMILIMPYGGILEYNNDFTAGHSLESFILNDLLPEIQNHYCTLTTQAGRDLAGISRGGFWVFEIGFRHPEVFGALAGHSPYFDPSNAPPAYNPLNLAQSVVFPPGAAPRLWLDVAADDGDTRQSLDGFAQTLIARSINPG